ncbi:MAG: hypothetical protein HYX22_03175 [Candidatus Yanofskybacteria bacterium]|nr:hypothetical protein [Candidatus Yanofskybacteria bacterium]
MDTNELKKLLKGSTAVLILEDGEPSFVILGYDAYKSLLSDQEKEIKINHPAEAQPRPAENERQISNGVENKFQHRIGEKEAEMLEKINKQILALKGDIEKEEKGAEISAVD